MSEIEKPAEGHVFNKDDEIYVIDENGVDLWKAKIKKVNKKSVIVTFEDLDEEDEKFKDTTNFIERTEENNKIYEEQSKKREELAKEEEEENIKEKNVKKKKTKRIKTKKPVFNHREIVKSAWAHGIREIEQFRKYMTKNLDSAMEEYDKYFKMMNVNEFHLFILSNITNEEEEKFWKESLLLWQNMFPNDVAVATQILIKKLAELIKLPNQTETNARDVLEFIFAPENNKETEFSQFCAFLAMFDQVQQQFVR